MSAIVGERDRALRSTVPRNINPTAGKDLLLDADPGAAHFNYDGTATTPTITLTAKPIGFDATVLWSIAGGGVLSGTGKNVRTMAASSMTSASVRVVITSVFEGQAYIATRTIFKSTDGKPGADAPPVDMSPAAILAALEGRITDSQLYADLRSKINLITDPVSVPGSVQAQVKAETDARVVAIGTETQIRNDAIGKEVGDRIAAVLAESGARTTYVQQYTFSKEEVNSALSIQATQIAAAYTYVDNKTGGILSTAAADVRNYSYSKADTTSAISAAETRLRAEFVSGNGATEAYVQNWSYSKATIDSAEATQTATLTTSYQGYADLKKSEAKADAAADVRNYAYSKSDANTAEAAQSATLTTNYTAYADAARTAAESTASADVRQYAYSKSTVDSAISSAMQQLRSEFVGSGGATEAYVTNYAYSKSQIDQAEALQSSVLSAGYTNAINGIQVAGRNLAIDSAFERGLRPWTQKTAAVKSVAILGSAGARYLFIECNAGDAYVDGQGDGIPVTPGKTYVIAFDYATAQSGGINYSSSYMYKNSGGVVGLPLPILDTASGRVRSTQIWVCPAGVTSLTPRFGMNTNGYAWLAVYNFMVAEGNKDTGWSPAPEDIAQGIAGAIITAAADVRQYAYAKSDAAGAFASQSNQITAAYKSYSDAANVQTLATSSADVRSYSVAKADLSGAIAQATSSLSTTVGQHTTTIQQQATSIGGLGGQLTWKIGNNGHVAGFGLASEPVNGVPYSAMIFNVDVLSVALPGGAGKPIFTVGQVSGQPQAVFRTDLLVDGAITARMLKIGTSDNIVPDPQFRDLGWWGRPGSTVGQFADAGQVTYWKGGSSLYLSPNPGVVETNTQSFQMTPGATYLIEMQVAVTNDWNGRLSAFLLIPGVTWYEILQGPAVANTGQTWPNGLHVCLNSNNPAKGIINCSSTYTVPGEGSTYASTCIKIMNSHTVGSCEIGSISVTRVVDSTLIGPGSVFTKHLDIDTGGDIHSGQQGFDVGNGFWLEGEGRGHGARMSIGRQFGRKIIMDPANDRLELVNPQLSSSMTASVSPSDFGLVRNANQQFTDVYAGNYTASAGNASANLTYQWSVSSESSAVMANMDTPTGRQCVISVTGKLAVGQEVTVFVYCTVTDVDSRVARGGIATITLQTTSF